MAIASVVLNIPAISSATSAAEAASTAASTASVGASTASVGASTAVVDASVANSLATVAKAEADSAVGSEPGAGEYAITDLKRGADGSIVIAYNDSAY